MTEINRRQEGSARSPMADYWDAVYLNGADFMPIDVGLSALLGKKLSETGVDRVKALEIGCG